MVVKIKKSTPTQIFSWEFSRIFSKELNISGRLHLWNRKPSRRFPQIISEAAVRMCSLKEPFWKIQENSQEITRGGVLSIATKNNTLGDFLKFFRAAILTFLGACFFGLWSVLRTFQCTVLFQNLLHTQKAKIFSSHNNKLLNHPLINLVIKSNSTCY